MFGYVNVYQDELKVWQYKRFRAYYCGLCRAIGRLGSQAARLGLSYDMTFLAILLSALDPAPSETEQKACAAHPFHKRENVVRDAAVDYAAHMSILLMYLKFYDDWKDDKSVKALLLMGLYRRVVRKAKKQHQAAYDRIWAQLEALSGLERQGCGEIDAAADCFAKILELLFTPDFITDENQRRALAWLGYNTGRWIYIIDAYADLEKDRKRGSYNPFLQAGKAASKQDLDISLTYTLHNIASAYELLPIHKNDEILRNILYLGLKTRQDSILNCKEEGHEPL